MSATVIEFHFFNRITQKKKIEKFVKLLLRKLDTTPYAIPIYKVLPYLVIVAKLMYESG